MLAAESAPAVLITKEDLLKRPRLAGVSIDPAGSHEIDDAIHVERGVINRNISRVQVHIANAGLLTGNVVVGEARERGWSIYYEDGSTDPMMGDSQEARSLSLDVDHFGLGAPAMTTEFTFAHNTGEISDETVYPSVVSCRNMTYRGFQRAVSMRRGERQVKDIAKVAQLLGKATGNLGSQENSKAPHHVVRAYMQATNAIKARQMQAAGLSWMFRNHHLHIFDHLDSDALRHMYPYSDMFAQRRMAWYAPTPTIHEGANEPIYCHYTSPLRRFPDLANHLNEWAALNGLVIPFPDDKLHDVAYELAMKSLPTDAGTLDLTQPA